MISISPSHNLLVLCTFVLVSQFGLIYETVMFVLNYINAVAAENELMSSVNGIVQAEYCDLNVNFIEMLLRDKTPVDIVAGIL